MSYIEESLRDGAKYRSDLLKWKVIAIAALGSAALGIGKNVQLFSIDVLCIAPLLCAYIDLLYRHSCVSRNSSLRFLSAATEADADAMMRKFANHETKRLERRLNFSFEAAAAVWSSVIIGGIVAFLPTFIQNNEHGKSLAIAGVAGIVLAVFIEFLYWRSSEAVHQWFR